MKIIRNIILFVCLALLLFSASVTANTNQFGANFDTNLPVEAISQVIEQKEKLTGQALTLRGEIIAQCQGDACWFTIKDDTGEILIDLNRYDFRVPLGIVGKKVELNGKVNTETKDPRIDATSVVVIE